MAALVWWVVQNTLIVGVLLPVVTILCRLFATRPAVQHALWMVLLLKFVTPPIVFWPWPLTQRVALPEMDFASPGESRAEKSIAVDGNSHAAPLDANNLPEADQEPLTPVNRTRGETETGIPVGEESGVENWATALPTIATLWACGAVIAIAVQLRRIESVHRLVKQSRAPPAWLKTEVRQAATGFHLHPPRVLAVAGIRTPLLWCLGTPRLLWPAGLGDSSPAGAWSGVIAHELAHLKRRDHWLVWLDLAAGVAYWWNPLYWIVSKRMRGAAELACDAWAVSLAPAYRRTYAERLLEISRRPSPAVAAAWALGAGSSDRRTFERRLIMIFAERVSCRISLSGLALACALAALAAPALLVGPTQSLRGEDGAEGQPDAEPKHNSPGGSHSSTPTREEAALDAIWRKERSMYLSSGITQISDPRRLPDQRGLTSLTLHGQRIKDEHLVYLTDQTGLEVLKLVDTGMDGTGLRHLIGLNNLQRLSLVGPRVTDAWLDAMPELPSLTHLGLAFSRVTDDGLQNLKKFPNLETVGLRHTQIGDEGLQVMRHLPHLRRLTLKHTTVSDAGLFQLRHVPKLENFSLASPYVHGPGLTHLAALENLKELQFVGPSATDDWMRPLEPLRNIEWLELHSTNVTAEGLAAISQWTQLKRLYLNNNPISDDVVQHLKNLYRLDGVDLNRTQVTPEGLAKLREALPDASIQARME